MAKKAIKKVVEPEPVVVPEVILETLTEVGEEYGREDLNILARTLNKVIRKING